MSTENTPIAYSKEPVLGVKGSLTVEKKDSAMLVHSLPGTPYSKACANGAPLCFEIAFGIADEDLVHCDALPRSRRGADHTAARCPVRIPCARF
jgi:hypothetical protein